MPAHMVLYVEPKNLGKYEKALGTQFRPLVIKITGEWGKYAVRALRRETNAQQIMWKRRVYRGWVAQRVNWHRMRVFNRAPHAVFVEEGRRAGARMPPDKPIRDWVKSRGLPESAIFPIRKKIADKGIAAKRVLTSPVVQKRMGSHLKRMVIREMNRHMRRAGRSV